MRKKTQETRWTATTLLALAIASHGTHASDFAQEPDYQSVLERDVIAACDEGCVNVRDVGASGDGWTDDTTAIQAAVDLAPDGGVVLFPAGRYRISGSLALRSGLSLRGSRAVLAYDPNAAAPYSLRIVTTAVTDLTIEGLTFDEVLLEFASSNHTNIRNVTIRNCRFINGRKGPDGVGSGEDTLQLSFGRGANLRVESSEFTRDGTRVGRGVGFWKSHDVVLRGSRFAGFYKTAINVNGSSAVGEPLLSAERSRDVLIEQNTIERAAGSYAEDHGIYAWGVSGLIVRDNWIRGWSLTAWGHALKVRNADSVFILRNRLENSGILLYSYHSVNPAHLRTVRIWDNFIDLSEVFFNGHPAGAHRVGISYWRNFQSEETFPEKSIHIDRNEVRHGSIVIHEPVVAEEVKLTYNEADEIVAPQGTQMWGNRIDTSGCE